MTVIRVVITDDQPLHRNVLKSSLAALTRDGSPFQWDIVTEFQSGQELVDHVQNLSCDLFTLDIRMPTLDGLSTLHVLRSRFGITTPICMVSSENPDNIDRFLEQRAPDSVRNMSVDEKYGHLKKVEDRLTQGIVEEGKINTLLEACEKLAVNPITYAEKLGANGFLLKPYKPDQISNVIIEVVNGKTYTASHCIS